jgi:phosphoribosylanthranilate isomerase
MRIKICGLFREQDIDYVNEARPDYVGFVFAQSRRQVSPALAQYLRFRLADSIVPVGVFVNAPINDIAALFHNGVISAAQLHGDEDESYITQLKRKCGVNGNTPQIKVIKTFLFDNLKQIPEITGADYFLVDSGTGSGKAFNWKLLKKPKINKPWFLAGGVSLDNIEKAVALNPFAVDVSSGAETNGIKDREKILKLITIAREGNVK